MIGECQCHRRGALSVAWRHLAQWAPQGEMRTQPVVLEDLHGQQRIPGGIAFSERMRLAGESGEPVTQRPIEALHMHRAGICHQLAQHRARFDADQVAVSITVLNGLGQLYLLRHHSARSSTFAGGERPTILLGEDVPIALPAITAPGEWRLIGSIGNLSNGVRDQWLTDPSGCGSHDEATGAILHETSPALTGVGFV